LRAAAEAAARDFGPTSVEAAIAFNQLGVACKFAGRFDEAEAAYARALPIAEANVGSQPDLLATLLHNLGGLAHSRGRYSAAEEQARRGLAIRKKSGDQAALAGDLAALAAILEGQERWADAEELYRRALSSWETEGNDYEVAMTLNGLAAVVRFGGRPEEAEPLFRRALELVETQRGPRHPDSSTVRNNLAMLLNARERPAEALPLLEQAAADLVAMLGPDHPATRDVRTNRDRVAATVRLDRD
jgi:tetratricopeptide (TPR) repeat protein